MAETPEQKNRRRLRMPPRAGRIAAYGAIAIALIVLVSFGFESWRADRISDGVTVVGVELAGLDRAAAEAKLRRELEEPLLSPVKAVYEGESSTLSAAGAGIEVDVEGMTDQAVDASHSGFFVVSALRNALGLKRNESVSNRISYSQKAVNNFVDRIARAHNREKQNAKLNFTATGLGEVDGQPGVRVRERALRRKIVAAFTDPALARRIKVPVKRSQPSVKRRDLATKYPVALTVDRSGFRIRLFKKLKLEKSYRVAVGQVGLETPAGLYSITSKQVNPAWHVPNSDWAGDLAGKTIPPGDPGNPLKARWLGIYGGVGIHGTSAIDSIGSAASHGCIRMVPKDVIDLYERVPVGAPVYIG